MKRQLFFFLLIISNSIFAQLRLDTLGWIPPVDIPIYLSGNFAELRTGHFHAGIDIKTQGQEGFKIHAVQKGYISRIKVASGGYGKAIYISHPDGYTSVYGHLKEYNIQLDRYVRNIQYERKSYGVDIFPERGELIVNQGDVIGLSGNSGSSGGPHLHFEIRDSRTSRPMNGLFLGFDIQDNIPPRMDYLYVYPKGSESMVNNKNHNHYYSLKRSSGSYALRQGDTLMAYGNVGLGLKVNDYLNGSANRCGVYELKGYIDNKLFFHEKFDGVGFDETRYINSLMDYKENVEKKRKLHKLYIDPNNHLSVYVDALNRGVLSLTDNSKIHKVRLEAIDAYQNQSDITFYLKVDARKKQITKSGESYTIPWEKPFNIDTLGLKLNILANSFYDTVNFELTVDTNDYPNTYSPLYGIHNAYTPIHKAYGIEIQCDSVSEAISNRLLLAQWYKNKFSPLGGKYKDGKIKGSCRTLGLITVVADTIAPNITPLVDLSIPASLMSINKIKFKIEDDFSGINNYSGYINDKWVLFEYDAKNDLISYEYDENMPLDGMVEIKILATDERGNQAIWTRVFENYLVPDNDIGQ